VVAIFASNSTQYSHCFIRMKSSAGCSASKPLGFIHASAPQMSSQPNAADLAAIKRLAALHTRVGLLEMTKHEFLDPQRKKERSTFADGTTVTVDWDTKAVTISPEVKASTAATATKTKPAGSR